MDIIKSEHGSGGKSTSELIKNIFARHFDNEYLAQMEDSSVVPGHGKLAVTTDSFVVDPYIFDGGDIGRLAVCGTVNDLLVRGATPKYLTCGFILQEGLPVSDLEMIVKSMADTAREAGVQIVTGDTKVVPGGPGLYINTTGVGFMEGEELGAKNVTEGDVIIASGNLGDHHVAILKTRLSINNNIKSDVAPLGEMVGRLTQAGLNLKAMRDITRGGLGTIMAELATASGNVIELSEEALPVSKEVSAFTRLLGLEPLYMGNEGKLVLIVDSKDADKAIEIIKGSKYGENACIIGRVLEKDADRAGLYIKTPIGGRIRKGILIGEGLPRIC